jgi:hypothetical protein
VALLGIKGTVHIKSILEVIVVKIKNDHSKNIADAEFIPERDHAKRLGFVLVEKDELAGGSGMGIRRKIHSSGDNGGAKRKRFTHA